MLDQDVFIFKNADKMISDFLFDRAFSFGLSTYNINDQ